MNKIPKMREATLIEIQQQTAKLRDRAAADGLHFLSYLLAMAHDAAGEQITLASTHVLEFQRGGRR